ncbi:MAG: hypothetical protein Ct9H300mP12_06890 [Acidimicrobiales bacterium]|nr:MAG: hypothetical protein Ct9H300mP12_06890 [Acidimicrobiales bacterium]
MSCAVALANLKVFADEGIIDHVQANELAFRAALDNLADLPIVGDIRGAGYFYGIELVRDRDSRKSFSDDEGGAPTPGIPVQPSAGARPDLSC